MGTNILEQRMIEDTLDFFQGNDGLEVSPAQGVMLIDGWLQALERDANVDAIRDGLHQLREELNHPTPDPATVKTLLDQLADAAEDMAQGPNAEGMWTGRLQSMSELLRNFSNQL
jgi:flagellar hook-associated protein FlgK